MSQSAPAAASVGSRNSIRTAAAVGIAIVVALIVWLVVRGGDHKAKTPSGPPPASAVSVSTLRGLSAQLGHEIYWAGRRGGFTYELTQVNGNTFIRYLPAGVSVGDRRPDYLTVGTYPRRNSYTVLKQQARQRGDHSVNVLGGGLAVWSDGRPQSVYVAYPKSNLQVEIYDPSAPQARRLATSGAVKPVR
jgi:hypothetical protein